MAEHRPRYTHAQIDTYFDRICLPASKRVFNVSTLRDGEKLRYLKLLQKHQLVKVPWENLEQHYSWHHVVDVEPQHLFGKIAQTMNGRGGYCMEVNSFMGTVLMTLGFDVYTAGARIYSPPKATYGGWTHLVNLVTINGTKYLIDGGYGGNGPCTALPLEHGREQTQIAPASMRLMHQAIPQNLDKSQKVWVYQLRINDTAEWQTQYCFVELEFLPSDIVSMNAYPATSRHTFFTHQVVCIRFTTAGEKFETPGASEKELEEEIDGALILAHGSFKWRRNGEIVVRNELRTEAERLDVLEKYYGIYFAEADRRGIRGTAAELVPRYLPE